MQYHNVSTIQLMLVIMGLVNSQQQVTLYIHVLNFFFRKTRFNVFDILFLTLITCMLQIVTLASTTFLLTAMSFDRYLAICRPLRSLPAASQTRRWRMIVVAWVMAFIFATPQLLIFKQVNHVSNR